MEPTAAEIAREVFPGLSDDETNAIAWAHTGYPAFWATRAGETWQDCFRRQLEEYRDGQCPCDDCRSSTGPQ